MSDQQHEFNSDNLSVTMQREPGCQVKLTIKASPKAAQAAYQKAVKTINKEISFPGFRKGKAPVEVILQKFPREIQSEWSNILCDTAFQEALELVKVYPYRKDSVKKAELKSISQEDGAVLEIEFEHAPNIPDVDMEGFKFSPIEKKEVTEQDVEKALHRLLVDRGTFTEVSGRGVKEGDFVMLDIFALNEQGEVIAEDKGKQLEVKQDAMPKWIYSSIIGLEAGQSAEGELDEKIEEGAKGKFTVLQITEGTLPTLDDEFAKSIGAQDLNDLNAKVKAQLVRNNETLEQNQKADQVQRYLVDKYPFDVPRSTYEPTVSQFAKFQKSDTKNEADVNDLVSKMEQDMIKATRRFFLANQLAKQYNIAVSNEEVYMGYLQEKVYEGKDVEADENTYARIYSGLLQAKVYRHLASLVKS